jgi:dipeptidyl-peptidase 4
MKLTPHYLIVWFITLPLLANTQPSINLNQLKWLPGSHSFWVIENRNIVVYSADNLKSGKQVLSQDQLIASGFTSAVQNLVWSTDEKKILIYTDSKKVWRANTRGDYWLFDLTTGTGKQLGNGLPPSSLMFAKLSPDGTRAAYVSGHNLYVENLTTHERTALTTDGTDRIINGTFDWVYEEELSCRDGFRWSPDGKSIAYWRLDATKVPNHLMINNTDALYPFVIPVEYPKAGEKPSPAKVGVVSLDTRQTTWINIPGDPQNNYIPRMEWANVSDLIVMQLNRKQNEARLFRCDVKGNATQFYVDKDEAWVDATEAFGYDGMAWRWVESGKSFLYSSEKDGWRHIYKVSADGKKEELITAGAYDAELSAVDAATNDIYFIASPKDATQRYLYKVNLKKKDTIRITPSVFPGTNNYSFSPDAKYARHINSNITRKFNVRLVSLKNHQKVFPLTADQFEKPDLNFQLEKIKVKTADGIEMDGIMARPNDFNPDKKYPICFFVYGEPAGTVAKDMPTFNGYISQLVPEGYIGIALDNRGTPSFKGREWRKSIYRKMGPLNAHDQAMAAREIIKWKFIDPERVAVHGWSGGGNTTLNLLFRYPDLYKTGVAVASVTDHRFYDNIYTERYMGLPDENAADYEECSILNHAKNLNGNLLYVHGTGDDNVHYKNGEMLINELIKHNKLFSLMIYPNRTHGISEGEGTKEHLSNTILTFLRTHNPPGGR